MQRKPTIQMLLRQHPQFFSITNVTVNEEKILNADNDILKNKFDYTYNMIVHWRKSLFLLLSVYTFVYQQLLFFTNRSYVQGGPSIKSEGEQHKVTSQQ